MAHLRSDQKPSLYGRDGGSCDANSSLPFLYFARSILQYALDDATSRRRLLPDDARPADLGPEVWGQRAVRRPCDWIFIDARLGAEEAGEEVHTSSASISGSQLVPAARPAAHVPPEDLVSLCKAIEEVQPMAGSAGGGNGDDDELDDEI